jgi:hypothetical protein
MADASHGAQLFELKYRGRSGDTIEDTKHDGLSAKPAKAHRAARDPARARKASAECITGTLKTCSPVR